MFLVTEESRRFKGPKQVDNLCDRCSSTDRYPTYIGLCRKKLCKLTPEDRADHDA